jgi:hypothetical protein
MIIRLSISSFFGLHIFLRIIDFRLEAFGRKQSVGVRGPSNYIGRSCLGLLGNESSKVLEGISSLESTILNDAYKGN